MPLLAFHCYAMKYLQPATNQIQLVPGASQDYKKPWLAGFWELKLGVAGGRNCSALEHMLRNICNLDILIIYNGKK